MKKVIIILLLLIPFIVKADTDKFSLSFETPKDMFLFQTKSYRDGYIMSDYDGTKGILRYYDKEGELISGVVALEDEGNYYIDLGRTNGILPKSELIGDEKIEIAETKKDWKDVELNKNLKKQIDNVLKDWVHQLDLIVLFYISFFDLSTQFKKSLSTKKIISNYETAVKNCEKLLKNPIIIKSWIFAFLEILDKLFTKLNLDPKSVKIMDIQNINNINDMDDVLNSLWSDVAEDWESSVSEVWTTQKPGKKEEKKMSVDYFWTNLTNEAKDGFTDPVIGRENEINQVIYTLLRKTKNNPLLIWEAWVWKTAIIEGLAQKKTMIVKKY